MHGKRSMHVMRFTNFGCGGAPKISTFGMCLSGAFSKGAMEILTTLRKKSFRVHPLLTTLPVTSAIGLHATTVFQTGGCEFVSETYSIAWQNLLCQESEFAKPLLQQLYQWTMQLKYSKWSPLGTIHKRYELILRIRVI